MCLVLTMPFKASLPVRYYHSTILLGYHSIVYTSLLYIFRPNRLNTLNLIKLSHFRVKVLECSAKDDINIKEIFRSFLSLSRILPRDSDDSTGLKRRSSAYVSASKGGRRAASPAVDKEKNSAGSAESSNSLETRSKPRSRSLIRRASRKTKQQIRDAHNGVEECTVS